MSSVIIYGNGQMARLAHYYLTHDSDHEVVAFTVERRFIESEEMDGLPLIALEEAVDRFPAPDYQAFVAMGYGHVNRDRADRFAEMRSLGYRMVSYISSRAITWPDLEVGENCFVMEGNVIQPMVSIGDDVTLGPGNTIGHHCTLGDHCFLASAADLSGHATIGPRSFLGANSTIRNAISVGADNVVGAGAVIMADTADGSVYAAPRARLLPLPSHKLPRI